MADFLADLLNRFRSQPQAMTGQGMARQAGDQLQNRAYQLYVQEMRSMGQQPLPPAEWMAQNNPQGFQSQQTGY